MRQERPGLAIADFRQDESIKFMYFTDYGGRICVSSVSLCVPKGVANCAAPALVLDAKIVRATLRAIGRFAACCLIVYAAGVRLSGDNRSLLQAAVSLG